MSRGYFIDTHVHVRANPSPERVGGGTYPTPARAIEVLKPLGVRKAVILPGINCEALHDVQGNGEVLAIAAQWPEFFVPFMNIDPRQLTNRPDADLGQLMRFYKEHGCRGIGEVSCNLAFDDAMVDNLFAHAQENGLPLLFHIGHQRGGCYGLVDDLGLPRLERALRKFPELRFIGHSQPFWAEISADVTEETRRGYPDGPVTPGRVVDLMRSYPNLYADLSPASGGSGFNAIRRDPEFGFAFMEEFRDRLLFATDFAGPNTDMALVPYLNDALEEGRLCEEAYDSITHANAEKLLDIAPVAER